jgi:23S rRNA (cytidine1920-2'-O)/16S rRNA (cytidine1409-2'-O)-methyltransferase
VSASKTRLDKALVQRGLAPTRSQAESSIRLGEVKVGGRVVAKPGTLVRDSDDIVLTSTAQYVSRAGLKLASVAHKLQLNFADKTMLDVGSSTGGFTDFALQHGAKKVYAVDVGTHQLHPSLRSDARIELHEKTDIRDFTPPEHIDMVVIDVSFISLREILPHIVAITDTNTQIVAMVKPQFEAQKDRYKHKGVIKNDAMRRQILKDFEVWVQKLSVIVDKADSDVAGAKGNLERFYLLKPTNSSSAFRHL